jgi:hypothetical protein
MLEGLVISKGRWKILKRELPNGGEKFRRDAHQLEMEKVL